MFTGLVEYEKIRAMSQADLFVYSAGLPCRLICLAPGVPYLERYFLGIVDGVTFYLHRFVAADVDEETHDHPWPAAAVCLHGGYREEVVDQVDFQKGGICTRSRWIVAGDTNHLADGGLMRGTFHRICEALPETWTLFAHGARQSSWGFLQSSAAEIKYVHWRKHIEGIHGEISDEDPDKNKWWEVRPLGCDAGREDFAL